MLQDDRDNLELDKLQIENRKLAAEALKFMAEERKLRQEAFWPPFATGSVILTAIAGIMALLVKLLKHARFGKRKDHAAFHSR
jgi:glycopeptide antibiotics resistance protein